jgi:hypothetical protein
MNRPPLAPFTAETAAQKVRMAKHAWNSRDRAKLALAYTVDNRWRNRVEFLQGREAIEAFFLTPSATCQFRGPTVGFSGRSVAVPTIIRPSARSACEREGKR